MATIDIRDDEQTVDTIVFGTGGDVEEIKKNGAYILFKDSTDAYVLVRKADVNNLIKALQKAVELGWTK